MTPWQQALEIHLSAADAPSALTVGALARAAAVARHRSVPDSTLHAWIRDAVTRLRLLPVTRGLYLNRFTAPPGRLVDAVSHVRRDAVVSLHTALADAGLLNNPPVGVTAVLPLDSGPTRPRVGRVATNAGTIDFHAVPRRVLEAGSVADRLDLDRGASHPRATPEKALLDWLYLAVSPHSKLMAPALHDLEVEALDSRRLVRLSRVMNLERTLAQWRGGYPTQ